MSERTGQFDPSRTPGQVGVAPPPGAPIEVALPLDPAAVAQQLAKATANERALKPLVFQAGPVVTPGSSASQGSTGGGKTAPSQQRPGRPSPNNVMPASRSTTQTHTRPPLTIADGQPLIVLTDGVPPAVTDTPTPAVAEQPELAPPPAIRPGAPEGKLADVVRAQLEQRARLAQPAASNSMDPTRGVPRGTTDPAKAITGGFGDAVGAQYFPLDGTELRELVLAMCDKFVDTLQNDLRFSIATVYPRVAVSLELRVEGFVEDIGFTMQRALPPYTKTPVEIARQLADEGVFVVKVTRAEMSADGTSDSPPNAIREELGLQVPRKQRIQTPGGFAIVDVTQ